MTVYIAMSEAVDESASVLGVRRTFAGAVALCEAHGAPEAKARAAVEAEDGDTLIAQGRFWTLSVYREDLPE